MHNQQAPVRIVHCADYGGPYAGSFVPMLIAAAKAARRGGYGTTVCFSEVARDRPWLSEFTELAEIRFIERSGARAELRQMAAVLAEADGRPAILHSHFGTFDVPAALMRVRRRRTAVVWHSHSARDYRVRLRGKVHGAVLGRLVNATICVSPEIYEDSLARCFPAAQLVQMPNAIDLERFAPVRAHERSAARLRLGLSEGERAVLHFAWNWRIKGGDRMLAVAELMAGEGIRFMTVVGESDSGAPEDLLDRSPAVTRMAPRGEVRELYAASDVFLNCSRTEGMPYAVLEALASGLPVVATDLPAQRAVLAGLPGARIVASAPESIAAGVRELLALTPQQRAEHAHAGRIRVATSYSLERWAERLVELYGKLLAGGRPSVDAGLLQSAGSRA